MELGEKEGQAEERTSFRMNNIERYPRLGLICAGARRQRVVCKLFLPFPLPEHTCLLKTHTLWPKVTITTPNTEVSDSTPPHDCRCRAEGRSAA